ncbi:YlbG family protein [Pediococcus stilesii]|uniref:DUF2129 domain-containing protein n=1 Tax=Pediococcus stilesii TaxID=331679 RepID=A0A0R2KXA0_9LACO|nr:YlbG family protein [Pediococcus stilesii]KRN94046.1 hypothetical protein IV81_GL001689 [Pediococcus stilesii]TLQ04971.1 DUF2129 domain-containing protein [Pediococcus stilesii]
MEIVQRQSIVIFFNQLRKIGPLKRVGDISYISKEMHYLIIYVNKSNIEETLAKIKKMSFVKSAYISPRARLRTDYSNDDEYKAGE